MTGTSSGFDRRTVLAATGLGGASAALGTGNAVLAQAQSPAPAAAPQPPPASSAVAARAVNDVRDAILRISREVWANAELSLHEVKSSAVHVRELEAAGFRTVSTGTAGVPTAFLSEWRQGSGGPVLAFLPEYDALPDLGNAAEARRTPGPTGSAVGHGCGHNVLGAGATGGAIALKRMMEAARTPGTIRVYGCAAEETEGAKIYMVRDGLFDDVDAALAWHPGPVAAVGMVRCTANNMARVSFRGRTAHAGNEPWQGRSALKAAVLFDHGIQSMREHLQPTTRIHFIYENAGVAPNVVPDFAQIWMMVRDVDREAVNRITDWTRRIAQGAGLMTETEPTYNLFYGTHQLLLNMPLIELTHRHIVGAPLDWSSEEQAFARACQKESGLREAGLATAHLPIIRDAFMGGSTDVGDITFVCPTVLFAMPAYPLGVSQHTWVVTACGGMSIGDKGALAAARVHAGVGFDLMSDRRLLEAAKADFRERRGSAPYVSPLPVDRRQPMGLPAFLRRPGADEVVAGAG
jgi:aminobenzoyl-glutamate utilization protein B